MQFNVASQYQAPKRSATDQLVPCTDCGGTMIVRTSNSENNPGRDFWACPSRCKGVWGGWVDEGPAFSKKPRWAKKNTNNAPAAAPVQADNDRLIRIEAKLDMLLGHFAGMVQQSQEEVDPNDPDQ